MSDRKSEYFSFRAMVFASNKLVSLIAATMLLLLVDGAIHDAPAPTNNLNIDHINQPIEKQSWFHHGEHPKQHKVISYSAPTRTNQTTTTQQTSVQQDITSTGNSATQTPLPQSVCNMMINGQCNPNTVTAFTAVVATAIIGGITAGVVTAVNNQAQQQQQEQQKNNDLMTILAIQNGQRGQNCRQVYNQQTQQYDTVCN